MKSIFKIRKTRKSRSRSDLRGGGAKPSQPRSHEHFLAGWAWLRHLTDLIGIWFIGFLVFLVGWPWLRHLTDLLRICISCFLFALLVFLVSWLAGIGSATSQIRSGSYFLFCSRCSWFSCFLGWLAVAPPPHRSDQDLIF